MLFCCGSLGSFGHFQASRSGVHKGGLEKPIVKAGFVATRISVRLSTKKPILLYELLWSCCCSDVSFFQVTNLNLEIVRALARGTS